MLFDVVCVWTVDRIPVKHSASRRRAGRRRRSDSWSRRWDGNQEVPGPANQPEVPALGGVMLHAVTRSI